MPSPAMFLCMADIAALAQVQRPVVSVWRRRAEKTAHPFPAPVGSERGQLRFDAVEVGRWLDATGRGNNPNAADDAARFATLAGRSPRDDRVSFDAMTALLCLKVMIPGPLAGRSRVDLLDLADEFDPDDEFLFSELQAVGDGLEALAQQSDLLTDAAFSPAAAFEQLMADRHRSNLSELTEVSIAEPAITLVARLAVELGYRDGAGTTYADLAQGSSDLLLAVLAEHGDRGPVDVVSAEGDDATVRLVRRRLRTHDVLREGVRLDHDLDPDRVVMHIAAFPSPAAPAVTDADVLEAVERLVLQMGDQQRGVVVAPASALSDRPNGERAARVRDDILRAGHVHAIARLPRGQVSRRSRQALALWVLGPAQHDTPPADRFVFVADLIDEALTPAVTDSLVTDLVAATGGRSLARAHSFRFARPVLTRALLAAERDLVELGALTTPAAFPHATDLHLQIGQVRTRVEAPVPSPTLPRLLAVDQNAAAPSVLGSMLDRGTVRLQPGHRLEAAHLRADDGVVVLGVEELTGATEVGDRRIDRLVLARTYDAARFTEPGDVLFCTSPYPAALVDPEGSSVAVYPARILRISAVDPGGLLPEVLAADINALPKHARTFRRWPLRLVRDAHRRRLKEVLAELRRARAGAQHRIDDLDALAQMITDGVTSGVVDLNPAIEPTRGR